MPSMAEDLGGGSGEVVEGDETGWILASDRRLLRFFWKTFKPTINVIKLIGGVEQRISDVFVMSAV
jgi:hypothetical protein